jgi:pyruvate, orthophosphate dikinase
MGAAQGILTSRGGMTSHAAVVARGWGKPCVAGCSDIVINDINKTFTNGVVTVHSGDWISIDGTRGLVISGKKDRVPPKLSQSYYTFMNWVREYEPMVVRANAETPKDAEIAKKLGAQGIGLARTEHMFFGKERINIVRKMIMAEGESEREAYLKALLPYQKEDFKGIFRVMESYPVTVRLLDPPLHEFLPQNEDEMAKMALDMGMTIQELQRKVEALNEHNPMLGHRGCRLGITHPSITQMQTRAILEAALELREEGVEAKPEIMVPLVGNVNEFTHQKSVILAEAERVFLAFNQRIDFEIGTMIEVPRAALTANEIADEADFFSFGTNDLTQMTLGYSRDDAASFIPYYLEEGILMDDPFQTIDKEGVGQLIHMAKELGRISNPTLKMGICGEHGGDPRSIDLCHELGLNYVSCSPFRVPVAHLAVAQAALKQAKENEELCV